MLLGNYDLKREKFLHPMNATRIREVAAEKRRIYESEGDESEGEGESSVK